jgi:TfuA protein
MSQDTRPVLFVGPSLAPATRDGLRDVEVLPPVGRGDIDSLFTRERPPTKVGIVDGVFLQTLAISPKEILTAMERHEVTFFGSSSIGALRAVELADFGMRGVGDIVEMFRSGEVNADDEVAITFDPDTLTAISEPMVNIRVALAAAVREEVVTGEVAALAVAAGKRRYFPDRTYPRLLRDLENDVEPAQLDALRTFLREAAPDAKRDDALALVREMIST